MAILIVDDETSIRHILRRVLEREHSVDEAGSVDEARRKLAETDFELVLCDINLSGESGLDLLRSVSPTLGDTAVVMVTGIDDPKVAEEAFEMGVYGYLVKPFTPNEVCITVESALRRRALEQSHRRLEEQERELRILSDRERIGRDLHATVIQRLFSTGLLLQSASGLIGDRAARSRVEEAIEELDVTIRDVRTAIFDIDSSTSSAPIEVRALVLQLVGDAASVLGSDPRITFSGPVDSVVGRDVAHHLLGALHESLSNVVRHASARAVEVDVDVAADEIVLRVRDDGAGMDGDRAPGAGITGMRTSAEQLGGTFAVQRRTAGGTEVEWRVPLTDLH